MASIFKFNDSDFIIGHTLDQNPVPENFAMHTHDTTEIFYFVQGKGIFHIEGSQYELESGDLLIMRPMESHYIEIDCTYPYERKVINFKTDFLKNIDPENILLKPIFERKSGKLNLYKSYDFKEKNHEFYIDNMMSPTGDTRINIVSNLLPLLNEIYKAYISRDTDTESETETLEYRITRYINKHLSSELSLDGICKKYYISKPQLCRLFKKSTGTTVWQYITIKRLAKAREMILSGESPSHIYTLCGFSDYSAFYRAYIKHFGHSPKGENITNGL